MEKSEHYYKPSDGKLMVIRDDDEVRVLVPGKQVYHYDPEKPPTIFEFQLDENFVDAAKSVDAIDEISDFAVSDLINFIARAVWEIAESK